jgi:hypothetical protein|tara:strand:+ start:124 stop:228 length:105 start_codon:yes stop_codon:yes gene_type:complete
MTGNKIRTETEKEIKESIEVIEEAIRKTERASSL